MPSVILDIEKLKELERKVPGRAAAVVQKLAQDCESNAKRQLEGTRTGRTYRHGTVEHQASAPGEAPAVDTGYLKNSITAIPEGKLRWVVAVGAVYGIWLEYGTVKKGTETITRMAARPFMLPAVRETIRRMPKGLLQEVVDL